VSRWRRPGRRGQVDDIPFPDEWRHAIARRWMTWHLLSLDERARLEVLVAEFVRSTRWEAAQGFTVTDEMRVVIAAQACLLVLELDLDHYRRVASIIVHPRTMVMRGQHHVAGGMMSDAPQSLAGQAHHRGPVLLAWSTAAFEARHPERGMNVVFHEFAHQLDMLDGTVDGTPPLSDDAQHERWVAVCTDEFEQLRRGRPAADEPSVLRDYGATDPGEFFAVATETFFTRPVAFAAQKPELYDLLRNFYRQDPAERVARSSQG
jgi:Mlc titration factor MtfA (ptsG expression regulator)